MVGFLGGHRFFFYATVTWTGAWEDTVLFYLRLSLAVEAETTTDRRCGVRYMGNICWSPSNKAYNWKEIEMWSWLSLLLFIVTVLTSKSKSTLLSIFQFVCTDREIEIPFPTIPNTKIRIYIKIWIQICIQIYTQSTDTFIHMHTFIHK